MLGLGLSIPHTAVKGVPVAPAGFAFIIDGDGAYVTDGDGNYLMVEV